jgi:hypothetical protein
MPGEPDPRKVASMIDEQPKPSDQLPEEAPAEQVPDDVPEAEEGAAREGGYRGEEEQDAYEDALDEESGDAADRLDGVMDEDEED